MAIQVDGITTTLIIKGSADLTTDRIGRRIGCVFFVIDGFCDWRIVGDGGGVIRRQIQIVFGRIHIRGFSLFVLDRFGDVDGFLLLIQQREDETHRTIATAVSAIDHVNHGQWISLAKINTDPWDITTGGMGDRIYVSVYKMLRRWAWAGLRHNRISGNDIGSALVFIGTDLGEIQAPLLGMLEVNVTGIDGGLGLKSFGPGRSRCGKPEETSEDKN
jgi:hypothetical protein